jgi:hypothetical protein
MTGLLAAIPAQAEVWFDNTTRPQFARQVSITHELAEGVAFNGSQRVTGFTTLYHADTAVNMTLTFYTVAGPGQGTGSPVASFAFPNLAAGDHLLTVDLSAAQQFVWTATPGISNQVSGGYVSFRFTAVGGTGNGGATVYAANSASPVFDVTTRQFAPLDPDGAVADSPLLQLLNDQPVVDSPILKTLYVTPQRPTPGGPMQAVVFLSELAPAGGITLTVTGNAASLPSTAVIPAGQSSVAIDVVAPNVTTPTTVDITVGCCGTFRTDSVQVAPAAPADTVRIQRAEYRTSKRELRVQATSTNATATLTVFVTATNQLIGTLTGDGRGSFGGTLSFPVNPVNITVKSSAGGSASAPVSTR